MIIIETNRLILRTWKDDDIKPYYEISRDEKVIEFFLRALTLEEVKNFIFNMNEQQKEKGYTLWACELKDTKELIGFVGLNYVDWPAHFTPCVEIGWRLSSKFWGYGYATEGAKAALDYAFKTLKLKEIFSFTVPENKRSINVMEKIGLKRVLNGDFNHPRLPLDHKLSRHVLYKI